jgi:hypothetical protein
MKLNTLLQEKESDILKRWISLTLETYPPDVSGFLKLEKDRFTNPVGYATSTGSETLLNELIFGENTDKIISALDSIIKIRAVQDFTPSQAIAFIFLLKKAVREELKLRSEGLKTEDEREILEELVFFETKIDRLATLAFDVYVKCRDNILRIRMDEARAERVMADRLMRLRQSVKEKDSSR